MNKFRFLLDAPWISVVPWLCWHLRTALQDGKKRSAGFWEKAKMQTETLLVVYNLQRPDVIKVAMNKKKKCILLNYTSLSAAAYYVFSSIVKVNLRCSLDFRNIQTLVMHIRHLWMRGRRQGQQNGRIKSAAVCHLLIWHIVSTHAQCTPFGMTRLLRNMQTKTVAGSARSWQLRLINLCSWCNGDSTLTT